eukprot:Rmarinus@m.21265
MRSNSDFLSDEIAQLKKNLEATKMEAAKRNAAQQLNQRAVTGTMSGVKSVPKRVSAPAPSSSAQARIKLSASNMTAEEIEKEIQRQEALIRTQLQDRLGRVKAEEQLLHHVAEELRQLEAPLRMDVKELRKKIELVTKEEQRAIERHRKAEVEIQEAKEGLEDCQQRKKILCEQLSSIMQQSESRKQEKLDELNTKLATLTGE